MIIRRNFFPSSFFPSGVWGVWWGELVLVKKVEYGYRVQLQRGQGNLYRSNTNIVCKDVNSITQIWSAKM